MKSIIRRTLADEVAAKLQEQLSLGYYKPNDKLPVEAELMKTFGVGRSSIREAVRILANAGLLRIQQGLGTFVEEQTVTREPMDQRLKRASNKDLNEVRELLEMKIAEKAAANRSKKDITVIKKHLAARQSAAMNGLLEECIDADILFHTAIAEASKNEILADLYKAASLHLKKWFLQVHKDTSDFIKSQQLHQDLLDSIIAGDSKKAWQSAARIIGHVSQ
ncbi:MAG: FCD domain-containing protein [Chitinophagaceae bacterium]